MSFQAFSWQEVRLWRIVRPISYPLLLLGATATGLCAVPALANPITYTDSTLLIANYTILQGSSNGSMSFSTSSGALIAQRTISAGGGTSASQP